MVPDTVADQEVEDATPPASSPDIDQQCIEKNFLAGGSLSRVTKKTRDLPNFSECHNCGHRINTSNGRDRLQNLISEWRIVLLCRKCFCRVESGKVCPYCFLETSEECLRCRDCTRRVHKHCVFKYKSIASSSYPYHRFSGSGFTVCIDCWLPEPLVKLRSRAVLKGGSRSRKISKSGKIVSGSKDCGKELEVVAKDANSAMENKVKVAARARETAATKTVVAKRALELANNALDLVSKREGSDANCTNSAVVDDAELAFQLHRAINSSPRISRNLCPVNSSCLAVPDKMSKRSGRASDLRENLENGKCNGGKCNVEVATMDEEKSCLDKQITSSGDDNSLDTESESFEHEMHPNSISSHHRLDCDTKTKRFGLMYSRRNSSLETTLSCKPKFLYQGFKIESQDSSKNFD